ncbi:MAG: Hydroxymethylpyrimidine phosphate kinase ThiD, partial [uncultured Thermomicrobiales bacterium]
ERHQPGSPVGARSGAGAKGDHGGRVGLRGWRRTPGRPQDLRRPRGLRHVGGDRRHRPEHPRRVRHRRGSGGGGDRPDRPPPRRHRRRRGQDRHALERPHRRGRRGPPRRLGGGQARGRSGHGRQERGPPPPGGCRRGGAEVPPADRPRGDAQPARSGGPHRPHHRDGRRRPRRGGRAPRHGAALRDREGRSPGRRTRRPRLRRRRLLRVPRGARRHAQQPRHRRHLLLGDHGVPGPWGRDPRGDLARQGVHHRRAQRELRGRRRALPGQPLLRRDTRLADPGSLRPL